MWKECIYVMKETTYPLLLLPPESKSTFWILKKMLSFFLFFINLALAQFFFRMETALCKLESLYIMKEQFLHFVTTIFTVHGVLKSLI